MAAGFVFIPMSNESRTSCLEGVMEGPTQAGRRRESPQPKACSVPAPPFYSRSSSHTGSGCRPAAVQGAGETPVLSVG